MRLKSSYNNLLWFQMTQKLHFRRGNLVGDGHPLPSVSEAWLSVGCSIPSSIVLIADEPGKNYFP